jgi:transglutaminase-like putative cysteine protease
MRAFAERIARADGVPEDSIPIRVVVAVMVEIAVLAVVAQGAVDAATAAGALVLVPAGYAFSYARRRRPSVAVKVALAAALLVALGSFLRAVEGARSFDDARAPLAALFLWVQVLHSFDIPRRRDLGFSVVSSLILIAEAGALSFGTGFLLFLVPWLALGATHLLLTLAPRPDETPAVIEVRRPVGPPVRRRPIALARTAATWGLVTAAAIAVVFVSLPRLPGLNLALPPFRADDATVVPEFRGQVVNPGLSVDERGVPEFTDLAYPGFSSSVDLRSRGRLSDEVVMQVRSPQAALWRGLAYDTYDGTSWTTSDDTATAFGLSYADGFDVTEAVGGAGLIPSQTVLATFYVHAELPNVVFGAYRPTEVYFPASQITVDAYGSVRAPILLEDGVVYSVVSEITAATPDLLRGIEAVPLEDDPGLGSYLQLPADLPGRVVDLAERITAGATTRVDAVLAVESWLRANTEYRLDIPADPPGVDAVDHFLFERREGFCEHIASAMVVLLRSVGIPARFVTGFGPGARNPFTGYWDVRASDAHAWVEVFYPGVGWISYDPTFGVPSADPGLGGRLVAPEVLSAIGRVLSGIVPEPIREGAKALGRAIASAAGAWPILVVALAAGGAGAILLRRRRDRVRRGPPPVGAARAFVDFEDAMAARGRSRAEHQTAGEYLRAVRTLLEENERADAQTIIRLFERDRFSGVPASDPEVAAALEAAARLAEGGQGARKRISAASATRP